MLCPVCNVDMRLSDRQGVEIDYCPQCRGVWLDRGELEKIIERSTVSVDENQGYRSRSSHGQKDHGNKHGDRSSHGQENRSNIRGDSNRSDRKRGFLEDLFDF